MCPSTLFDIHEISTTFALCCAYHTKTRKRHMLTYRQDKVEKRMMSLGLWINVGLVFTLTNYNYLLMTSEFCVFFFACRFIEPVHLLFNSIFYQTNWTCNGKLKLNLMEIDVGLGLVWTPWYWKPHNENTKKNSSVTSSNIVNETVISSYCEYYSWRKTTFNWLEGKNSRRWLF